jgi:hypothetical protein
METTMGKKLLRHGLMVFGCLLSVNVAFVSGRTRPLGESEVSPFETRCGWFVNPTPANIWLYDKDGEWTIGVQGGYQIEDERAWPAFKAWQWVKTNGDYGYGCACMEVRVNKETQEVVKIKSARARSLAACRRDRSLRKWKRVLG